MQCAVRELSAPPDLVLVDGHLAPPLPHPCRPVIGGDATCYVISCASIMAKVFRDRLMGFYHLLQPQYGFDRHKGYGTRLHASRLRRFGPSVFHRRSFQPVAELLLVGVKAAG
jgi:ribonuclease HII